MKKIVITLLVLVFVSASCKDEIDDLFLNPDGGTSANIQYLFSDALTQVGAGLRTGYNPSGYYLLLQGISPWLQLTGNDQNNARMMDIGSNMRSNSWNAYYVNFMSKVAEMEILYGELPDESKADYDIYMNLIKVVEANATSKITDLYGDIPYSEAFGSRSGGTLFPKFDSQESIYTTLLTKLEEVSTFLNSFNLNDGQVHGTLATQDLLNGGNIDKWLKFTNSLRLRIAMRISDKAPDLAKSTVIAVVSSPLVLTNTDNILVEAKSPNGLNTRTDEGGQNFLARAFNDREEGTFAGKLMVNLMNTAEDPRRPYYFSKNEEDMYVGVPSSPDQIATLGSSINATNYSKINEELVLDNLYLPGIVITASEVNLLLAEAAQKTYITPTDAKMYYDAALSESVYFYYQMTALNTSASPTAPVASEVTDFVDNSAFAYDGTENQLATQKWIHFGILQANEAYAAYRKHDLPVLEENIPDGGGSALNIPTRILYPDSEKGFNEENYRDVQAADTPDTKVWWDAN